MRAGDRKQGIYNWWPKGVLHDHVNTGTSSGYKLHVYSIGTGLATCRTDLLMHACIKMLELSSISVHAL